MTNKLKDYWLVICQSKDLRNKPRGFEILGQHIVLFRSENTISALEDRCPHRNVPLSLGKVCDSNIQCSYHGWEFSNKGHCISIPGLSPKCIKRNFTIPRYTVIEKHGLIWINLNLNANPNLIQTEFISDRHIPSHKFVITANVEATLENAIENLLDGFHTPYVHKGLVRNPNNKQNMTAKIIPSPDRIEAQYLGENGQSGWISRLFERKRSHSFGRFILPSNVQLEYCNARGTTLLITVFFTPIKNDLQRIHAVIETPQGIMPGFIKRYLLSPLFKHVLKQDLMILKTQKENIERFGEEKFHSTRLDFMRAYIRQLLESKSLKVTSALHQERIESFKL